MIDQNPVFQTGSAEDLFARAAYCQTRTSQFKELGLTLLEQIKEGTDEGQNLAMLQSAIVSYSDQMNSFCEEAAKRSVEIKELVSLQQQEKALLLTSIARLRGLVQKGNELLEQKMASEAQRFARLEGSYKPDPRKDSLQKLSELNLRADYLIRKSGKKEKGISFVEGAEFERDIESKLDYLFDFFSKNSKFESMPMDLLVNNFTAMIQIFLTCKMIINKVDNGDSDKIIYSKSLDEVDRFVNEDLKDLVGKLYVDLQKLFLKIKKKFKNI